jgi:hypothetical protein
MPTSTLLAAPAAYAVLAYGYLAWWHGTVSLFNVIVHENGRLTLADSVLYFDHFLGSVPMVVVFSLCAVGGVALFGRPPAHTSADRAARAAGVLIGASAAIVLLSVLASVLTVGWSATLDYALQRIERDGIKSPGGNWNQFQLSNLPIALGTLALTGSLALVPAGPDQALRRLRARGAACIALAAGLALGITALTFPGWQAFANPRWVAHAIREVATHPLTTIPLAAASMVAVERFMTGRDGWRLEPRPTALYLLGAALVIVLVQLAYLAQVDVMQMAQRPAFAPQGLSVPYLLSAHFYEHFLDLVLVVPLTGGIYALVRRLGAH